MQTFQLLNKKIPLTEEIKDFLQVYYAYASLTPGQSRVMDRYGDRCSSAFEDLREAIFDEYLADLKDAPDELYDQCVEQLDEAWESGEVVDQLVNIMTGE